MATRNERVVLTLEDAGFSTGMAKAAAATAMLERNLDDLDGTQVDASKSSDELGDSLKRTEKKTKEYTLEMAVAAERSARLRKSLRDQARAQLDLEAGIDRTTVATEKSTSVFRRHSSDLNQFTGRVGLARDAILTLGPALIPIGAVAIPAVTGLASALGFVTVGATAAVVAFQGVGDALGAMNEARLNPTVENLAKAQEAMSGLAEPAREFVREWTAMGPALERVRDAAASGLFTQLTPALDDMEAALPRVASLFEAVGSAVGELGADAIEALTGPEWEDFFSFIEAEAPHALASLGSAVGSVAHGFGELWIAFGPLNRDFGSWLQDTAAGFDRWAAGLSQTDGFRDFVAYIQQNGPKVAEAMGALGNAFVQVIQAAAPLGGPVLQAIESFANAIATLADSPLGTPLFTLAAGLAAVGRASKLLQGAGIGAATFAGTMTNLATKGPAIVLALGSVNDAMERWDNINRMRETENTFASDVQELADSLSNSNVGKYAQDLGIDLQRLAVDLAQNGKEGEYASSVLDKLRSSSEGAANGFELFASNILPLYTANADKAWEANNDLNQVIENMDAGSLADSMTQVFPGLAKMAGQSQEAAESLRETQDAILGLNQAMLGLSGWLDKREALRGFAEAMGALRGSIKDGGFEPKDVAAVDAVGRSIVQMSSVLAKHPGQQRSFLQDAREQLVQLAKNAPKARGQINDLLEFVDRGLRKLGDKKFAPKIDADDKPLRQKVERARGELKGLGGIKTVPKADLEDGQLRSKGNGAMSLLEKLNREKATPTASLNDLASGPLHNIQGLLNSLHDRTIHVTTIHRTVGRSTAGGITSDTGTSADGGTVPKTGLPYADRHPYLLADGEEVISNRFGQADRHRALLKAINAGRLADGGTAGDSTFTLPGRGDSVFTTGLGGEARDAARGLRALNKQLKAAEKAVERERKQRDAIVSRQDQIRSGISNSFLSDPFGNLGSNVWAQGGGGNLIGTLQADLNGVRTFNSLLKGLGGKGSKGIDGAALEFLAQSGNVAGLQALAAMSPAQREQWERLFERRAREVRGVGNRAADQVLGAALARESRQLENVQKELRAIKQAIREESKRDRDNRDRNTDRRNRNDGKGAGNARRKARR